jgi:hypothetical protein
MYNCNIIEYNWPHINARENNSMHQLTLVSSIYQFSRVSGCAGTGVFFMSSGDNALTTMLVLGLISASYCTHKVATAASCNRQMSD